MILKKTLLIIAGFLFSFYGNGITKEWEKIRISTEGAYPPFNYVNADGKIVGFDVDIAKALCEELKAQCTIITQDWDGIIPGLLAHKYDAIIASMTITKKRQRVVGFTEKYYAVPASRFVTKKNSYSKKFIPTNQKIGVQTATVFQDFIEDNFPNVDLKTYSSQEQALLDLQGGRLDLVFSDSIQLQKYFLETKNAKNYEFVGETYYDKKWFGEGIGIAIRKQDKDLIQKFNLAIQNIRNKNIYQKISNKYFNYDIYLEQR